jgi:hypothetical protein
MAQMNDEGGECRAHGERSAFFAWRAPGAQFTSGANGDRPGSGDGRSPSWGSIPLHSVRAPELRLT